MSKAFSGSRHNGLEKPDRAFFANYLYGKSIHYKCEDEESKIQDDQLCCERDDRFGTICLNNRNNRQKTPIGVKYMIVLMTFKQTSLSESIHSEAAVLFRRQRSG